MQAKRQRAEIKDTGKLEFEEKVLQVDRVTYVVAGGKRLRFRTLVVVGNRDGRVGFGLAKAQEVPQAVDKAVRIAKKNLMSIQIKNGTIAHAITYKFGPAIVMLKPAPVGTSIIAGGVVRTVLELAGIKNVVSKILGSPNKINNVKATIEALRRIRKYESRKSPIEKQAKEKQS